MSLLKRVRRELTQALYRAYKNKVPEFACIESALNQRDHHEVILDHFAVIQLPSNHSGISNLCQIFSALGYIVQGLDYLAEKQNDFLWLTEIDAIHQSVRETLPQVVVADFRLHELPREIKTIVEKYSCEISISPLQQIQRLSGQAYLGDQEAAEQLLALLIRYFSERQWPLPTIADFQAVNRVNELLAWVLALGCIPNHFGILANMIDGFDNLETFMAFIAEDLRLPLNRHGGLIKGSVAMGIEQGATLGMPVEVKLADGNLQIPAPFIEFVWRYPRISTSKPVAWKEYYTGFMAQNANKVIESLTDR